jgi:hypothetical protein
MAWLHFLPFRGRKCNLCLRYEVLPMCRVAHFSKLEVFLSPGSAPIMVHYNENCNESVILRLDFEGFSAPQRPSLLGLRLFRGAPRARRLRDGCVLDLRIFSSTSTASRRYSGTRCIEPEHVAPRMTEQLVDNRVRHTRSCQPGRERMTTPLNGESRDPRQFQRIMPSRFNAVEMCTRVLRVEKDVLG